MLNKKKKYLRKNYLDQNSINSGENYNLKVSLEHANNINYPILNIDDLKQAYEENRKNYNDEKLNELIKDSFSLFDSNKKNEIEINDSRSCIYNLGICPNESQLKEIMSDLEKTLVKENTKKQYKTIKNNNKQKVSYYDFLRIIKPVIVSGKCLQKDVTILNIAYQTIGVYLDKYKPELIDWNDFKNLICSQGYTLSFEEVELIKDYFILTNNKMHLKFKYLKYLNDLERSKINLEDFLLLDDFKGEKKILEAYGFEIN